MYEEILRENRILEWGTARLPDSLVPSAAMRYALSFLAPLPAAVVDSVKEGPNQLYFHHYRTINIYLDQTALKIVLDFQNEGYDAFYVPASQSQTEDGLGGLLPHKAVARLAGLGSIGQNALFLSARYGPAVRLSTVVTEKELPAAQPMEELCLGCGRCVRACPSGALVGTSWREGIRREEMIDAKKCSMHMKKAYQKIGRGAVCGICMAVCPKCKK